MLGQNTEMQVKPTKSVVTNRLLTKSVRQCFVLGASGEMS
jgi:hypothetical protein